MYGRALVLVQKLDRVFDSDNVANLLLVNAVEQSSQGRRLARSPWPGNQHNPFLQMGNFLELRRKI